MTEGRPRLLRCSICTTTTVLAVALALGACSEIPTENNSVGETLISKNVVIHDTTIAPTGNSTFRQYVPMDSRMDLVGRTGNYTALTALQFTGLPERDTIQVVSATLTLRLVSWYGDSTGTLAFNVQKITQSWSQTTLQWDSIQTGFYESGPIRGSYTGQVLADTQVINVALDTSMVRAWLQQALGTTYGIMLVPTTSCTVVRGINAFDYDSTQFYPTLQVIAQNPAGTVRDTNSYTLGVDTFVGNIDNLASNQSLLYLQAGVVYRSTLSFDVSGIPRGAVIDTAQLSLVQDLSTTRVSKFSGTPTIEAHIFTAAGNNSSFEVSSTTGQQVNATDTFSVDLRHAVQVWIKGLNYGLLLRVSSATEYTSCDLYTFYDQAAASTALRPRLRIKYVVQNP